MATTVDGGSEVERAQTDRKTIEQERKGGDIINLELCWKNLDSRGGELNKQERLREK